MGGVESQAKGVGFEEGFERWGEDAWPIGREGWGCLGSSVNLMIVCPWDTLVTLSSVFVPFFGYP